MTVMPIIDERSFDDMFNPVPTLREQLEQSQADGEWSDEDRRRAGARMAMAYLLTVGGTATSLLAESKQPGPTAMGAYRALVEVLAGASPESVLVANGGSLGCG